MLILEGQTCSLGRAFTTKVTPGLRPLVVTAFRLWSLKSGSSTAVRS